MKFGKRLMRILAIMPSEYREKLFLDYKMLKGHIKAVVNASFVFSSNDEPPTGSASLINDGHNELPGDISCVVVREVEEATHEAGVTGGGGDAGACEHVDFNEIVNCIFEDNTQAEEVTEEENTQAGLTPEENVTRVELTAGSDMQGGVQEEEEGDHELDVDSEMFIDWICIAFPSIATDLGFDYGISPQCVDGWELDGELWPNYDNEENSQLQLTRERLEGRALEQRGPADIDQPMQWAFGTESLDQEVEVRLEQGDIDQLMQWHSGTEDVDPEVEAFIHGVLRSEGDNADDVHLNYQVTVFKRMLDIEFHRINKIFVALYEHNVALMIKLELMKIEEEARQNSLHASISSWDIMKLEILRRRITLLCVDFCVLEYSSRINYEAAVKIMKKHDKKTSSDLRWNYIYHVEAQTFYVLQPDIQDYIKRCQKLMGAGSFQHLPPVSQEELYRDYGHVVNLCLFLQESSSVVTEHESSTHNAQSFHPLVSA